MKQAVKQLQDLAYNIGYDEGLTRDAFIKQDIKRSLQYRQNVLRYIKEWHSLKKSYIESLGLEVHCPVTKSLTKTLELDRDKHFTLGIKDASASVVPGKF